MRRRCAMAIAMVSAAAMAGVVTPYPANAHDDHAPCLPSWRLLESPDKYEDYGYLAEAINRHGLVGGRVAGGGPMMMWHPDGHGQEVDLGLWAEPQVIDLNDEGQVLGMAFTPSALARKSFVWDADDTSFEALPGTGVNRRGRAVAMNNSGALVGRIQTESGSAASLWKSASSLPDVLPTPDGFDEAAADDIGEQGVVTGRAWTSTAKGPAEVAVVRWRDGVPRIVDSPQIDPSSQMLRFVAGKYFAGVSFDPNDPGIRSSVAETGTATSYAAIEIADSEGSDLTGLTRQGYVAGQVLFSDDNDRPTAFMLGPTGDVVVLDEFSSVMDPHGFGHLTALFMGDELWVGTCLAPLLN